MKIDKTNNNGFSVDNESRRVPNVSKSTPDVKAIARLKLDVVLDRVGKFDHAAATKFLELETFGDERVVSDQHVQRLSDEIRLGTFNETNVVIATAQLGSKTFAINGQHTAWSVLSQPKDFLLNVRQIVYRVTNEEQLRLLYATFDRNKVRSDSHVTQVIASTLPMAEGLWPSKIGYLANAFAFWQWETESERRRLTAQQVVGVIDRDYRELFKKVGACYMRNGVKSPIARSSVLAAMFATFSVVPTRANEFWDIVGSGVGFGDDKGHPAYQLRELLNKLGRHTGRVQDRKALTNEEVYRICISSWNRWRKNERMLSTPRASKDRQKVL